MQWMIPCSPCRKTTPACALPSESNRARETWLNRPGSPKTPRDEHPPGRTLPTMGYSRMGLKLTLIPFCLMSAAMMALPAIPMPSKADLPGAITALAYVDPPFMDTDGIHQRGIAIDIARELFTRTQIPYNLMFVPPKRANSFATSTPGACVIAGRLAARSVKRNWPGLSLPDYPSCFYRDSNSPIRVQALSDSEHHRIGTFLGQRHRRVP